MLIWLWLLTLGVLGNTGVLLLAFWQMKRAETLVLIGHQFQSKWTFWLAFYFLAFPAGFILNFLFVYSYWYGFYVVFPGKSWPIQMTLWVAGVLAMFIAAWFSLGELPARNALVALVFLLGAVIAVYWK